MWCRKSRRVATEPLPWEPTMKDPLKGLVIWTVPENKDVSVTLFKDPRTHELEDKEWTFIIEDVSYYIIYFASNVSSILRNYHNDDYLR